MNDVSDFNFNYYNHTTFYVHTKKNVQRKINTPQIYHTGIPGAQTH